MTARALVKTITTTNLVHATLFGNSRRTSRAIDDFLGPIWSDRITYATWLYLQSSRVTVCTFISVRRNCTHARRSSRSIFRTTFIETQRSIVPGTIYINGFRVTFDTIRISVVSVNDDSLNRNVGRVYGTTECRPAWRKRITLRFPRGAPRTTRWPSQYNVTRGRFVETRGPWTCSIPLGDHAFRNVRSDVNHSRVYDITVNTRAGNETPEFDPERVTEREKNSERISPFIYTNEI